MNTATLEFPTLDAAVPAVPAVITPPTVPATLKATVLAQFAAIRPEIVALAARYDKVAFDVTTPKGLALAKAARLELRDQGRYMLQRTEKRLRDDANELKAVVTAEVESLIGVLLPVEQSIDAQIKAEEDRKAAAKAEAERLAAESLARHNERLAGIRLFVTKCQAPDMTSERIARGIVQLGTVDLTDEDKTRAVELADAHCRAVDAMRTLQAQALGREQEAARQEAIRLENERVAAELAQERACIEAEAAEIRRRAAALDEEERVRNMVAEAAKMPDLPTERVGEIMRGMCEAQSAGASPAAVEAAPPVDQYLPPSTAAIAPPAATPDAVLPATMTVGRINELLAPVSITSAGLQQLGFSLQSRPVPGVHFLASDWELMKAAIIKHVGSRV